MRQTRAFAAAFTVLFIGIATVAFTQSAASSQTANEILRKAEQSVYPDAFTMKVTMKTLESGSVESHMKMNITYKRKVGTRIEILSPSRSRGIRFLQKDSSLWMFNPRAGTSQAIRLSPRASFQGSVFSNRDIGDPQYSQEYNVRVAGNETIDQPGLGKVKAIVIEGTARNERVAYSKMKLWARASDLMLLKAEYFAKSGLLFKTMEFTDIRRMAGAERPSVLRMKSMDQKNKESIMTIDELQRDPALSDAIFTLSALTR